MNSPPQAVSTERAQQYERARTRGVGLLRSHGRALGRRVNPGGAGGSAVVVLGHEVATRVARRSAAPRGWPSRVRHELEATLGQELGEAASVLAREVLSPSAQRTRRWSSKPRVPQRPRRCSGCRPPAGAASNRGARPGGAHGLVSRAHDRRLDRRLVVQPYAVGSRCTNLNLTDQANDHAGRGTRGDLEVALRRRRELVERTAGREHEPAICPGWRPRATADGAASVVRHDRDSSSSSAAMSRPRSGHAGQ